MTMYLKWGIFSVQNGQILIVLLVKLLNWSASSKRKLPTVMDPWLYMTSKNRIFQFVLMFFCRTILSSHLEWKLLKQGTKSAPNNSSPASVPAASTTETFLLYHTSIFSFQFYHFDTADDCRVGHQRGNQSGLHCLLSKEVRPFRWGTLSFSSCLIMAKNTEMLKYWRTWGLQDLVSRGLSTQL